MLSKIKKFITGEDDKRVAEEAVQARKKELYKKLSGAFGVGTYFEKERQELYDNSSVTIDTAELRSVVDFFSDPKTQKMIKLLDKIMMLPKNEYMNLLKSMKFNKSVDAFMPNLPNTIYEAKAEGKNELEESQMKDLNNIIEQFNTSIIDKEKKMPEMYNASWLPGSIKLPDDRNPATEKKTPNVYKLADSLSSPDIGSLQEHVTKHLEDVKANKLNSRFNIVDWKTDKPGRKFRRVSGSSCNKTEVKPIDIYEEPKVNSTNREIFLSKETVDLCEKLSQKDPKKVHKEEVEESEE